MSWALGFEEGSYGRSMELLTDAGEVERVATKDLLESGIPMATERRLVKYEGEFDSWTEGGPDDYLTAMVGAEAASGRNSRHQVFRVRTPDGLLLHVPALVLMRACFRPSKVVFPLAFTTSNVDLVSFLDFSESTPRVVVDDPRCRRVLSRRTAGSSADAFIVWLQRSQSAREMVQSVREKALGGWLAMALPSGACRINFFGKRVGRQVFVSEARMLSVSFSAEDSLARRNETLFFRDDISRDGGIRRLGPIGAPVRPDGSFHLTPSEWAEVEPLLHLPGSGPRSERNEQHLNLILAKLATGTPSSYLGTDAINAKSFNVLYRRWLILLCQ